MGSLSQQGTVSAAKPVPFKPSVSQFYMSSREGSHFASPNPSASGLYHDRSVLVLPAVYSSKGVLYQVNLFAGVEKFLHAQLDVSRLNEIHHHLWMAGKPGPGRALHQHALYGRKIVCTEQADLHLLWEDSRLLVKPCPDYLLSYDFWERYLCEDESLWEIALGLLQSYTWLIQHKSDWRLAQEAGILSSDVSWERWTNFVSSLCYETETKGLHVNPRFRYGNLRLSRVQWIYRLCSRSRGGNSLINGYFNPYPSYRSFFIQNTAPVTAAVIYFAMILGAMQVGLSTERLQRNDTFQNASLFFTILAIVGPVAAVVLLVSVIMSYVFTWNLLHAVKQRKAAKTNFRTKGPEP
jgi:hypothetical protein